MEQSSTRMRTGAASAHPLAAAIVAAVFSITGCQGMATTTQDSPPSGSSRADNTVADWPLKFVQHNFGSDCYEASDCSVSYNGLQLGIGKKGELQPALADVHPDALRNATAGQVGIMNFPRQAQVRWRSKDGTQLEAAVDIGEIFRDQLILHEVPKEDIPEGVSILNPDVLLVVNDRTINVYMRAFIPTKSLREAGNPNSNYRRDLKLAWSKTY
jgi:hypothetical protein